MADVELLPLPELPRQVEGYSGDYWEAGQVEEYATDYARACVEASLAPLQAENERLAEALRDAEKSLRTIANRAGGTEYLMTIGDVRGYANSRANEARAALAQEDRND